MRLHTGCKLHTMLEPAKIEVRALDFATFAVGNEPARAKTPETFERVRMANPRIFSTPHELERLDEELGFTDSAWTELEIALRIVGELDARSLNELHHLVRDARVDDLSPNER